jgi:hypothetical protein
VIAELLRMEKLYKVYHSSRDLTNAEPFLTQSFAKAVKCVPPERRRKSVMVNIIDNSHE